MNKKFIFIAIGIMLSLNILAQENNIEGYWLTDEGQSQIEIYEKPDGKFAGKIVWLEEPYNDDGSPVRDKENPKKSKRKRKIMGLNILKDFEYDEEDDRWEEGTIYDPESGKTYKCRMWFDDSSDILKVKGYIGVSFVGRTTEWRREDSVR
ncbi:MAG: DUF2147 domain-containing protein [Bacteroidota bacterium]